MGSAGLLSLAVWMGLPEKRLSPSSPAFRTPLALAVDGWVARPVKGRLTGGFSHAPYEPEAFAASEDLSSARARALLMAEAGVSSDAGVVYRGLEHPAEEDPVSTDRAHALLLQGRTAEAVRLLESMARARPDDPAVASDLSVALLERANRETRPSDLVRALAEAERALGLAPDLLEPAFNRAVALDALYLTTAARRAWEGYLEKYLEKESASPWAEEAADRLRMIEAVELGSVRTAGDPRSSDEGPGGPGSALLEEGIALYNQQRIEEALSRLHRAESLLAGRYREAALEARLYVALCHYQKADYDRAANLLEGIVRRASAPDDLPALTGRSHQVLGLIQQIRGRRGAALAHYRSAADALRSAGDRSRWAGVQVVLAELFEDLGNTDGAWEHRYLALAEGTNLDGYGRSRLYGEASSAMLRAGELPAARYFLEALAIAVEDSGNLTAVAAARRRLALLAHRQGDLDLALDLVDEAEGWASRIPDASIARISRGDAILARAEILADDEPELALSELARVEQIYTDTDFETKLPRVLLAQARAHRRLGQVVRAERDLNEALRVLQDQGFRLGRAATPGEFFTGAGRAVFDEAVDLSLDELRDPVRAFELASRALISANRELTGTAGRGALPRVLMSDVQAALDSSSVLIQYYVLEDRLLGWAIDSTAFEFVEMPFAAQERRDLAVGFKTTIEQGAPAEISERAEKLYGGLVRPVESLLRPETHVLLVPDGFLHSIPFGLLSRPGSGRYLVEDHPITVLPSPAPVAKTDRPMGVSSGGTPRRLLLVANPVVNTEWLALPPLPAAGREAEGVASIFPEATLLTGSRATPSRFLAWARSHEVVHFAGHAVSNARSPLLSYLVLSPEPSRGGTGALFAEDLVTEDLSTVQLVVLAACSTAGPTGSSAGSNNLARSFLAAGSRSVVGSLWPVEDAATEKLILRFYEELWKGVKPSEALRSAQLQLLRSGERKLESPAAWAGFQVVGSLTIHGSDDGADQRRRR